MDAGKAATEQRVIVEAHLRRLDTPALAAFVADLWAARGFDTDREGTVVRANRHGRTQRVHVGGLQPSPGGGRADIVVDTSGTSTYDGIVVLDASELTEQLQYAVDRPVARRLCERHLGADPASLSAPVGLSLRRLAGRSRTVAAVFALVAMLAVVGVATGGSWALPTLSGDATTSADDDGTGSPDSDSAGPSNAGESRAEQALPPGVTAHGISNIDTLATAHAEALEGHSYSLWVDSNGTGVHGGQVVRVDRDVDAAVDGRRYRIETDETVANDSTRTQVRYHDGRYSYVAPTDRENARFRRLGPLEQRAAFPRTPIGLTESLVWTRLSTPRTNLTGTVEHNGRPLYRLTGTGQPTWPAIGGVEAYTVTALVTSEGVVRRVSVEYTVRSGTRRVEISRHLQYGAVGETTVTPPAWYRTTGIGPMAVDIPPR